MKAKRSVTLAASASDADSGIATVEFRVCSGSACAWDEGASLATETSAPYAVTWKAPKKGTYTFVVRALDAEGNATLSSPMTITVKKKR